jgi:integrase/recombinase XerD
MAQGRQAKILTEANITRMLREVEASRYPLRDRVTVLLSVRAGLRAKEISMVTWSMVLDADGNVADALELHDGASKGKNGGRQVPLHSELRQALIALHAHDQPDRDARIIRGERDGTVDRRGIHTFFARLYARLGLKGCSSHSGRRTFVTGLAKRIVAAGGSLRDVQQLAGHKSLATTQGYIQGDSDAKRKAIEMLGNGK